MDFSRKLLAESSEFVGGSNELQKTFWGFISEKLIGSPEYKLSVATASEKLSHLSGFLAETLIPAIPSSEAAHTWLYWALIVAVSSAAGFAILYFFFGAILCCFFMLLRCLWNGLCCLLGALGVSIMRAPGIVGLLLPRCLFSLSPRIFFACTRALTKMASSRIGLIVLTSSAVVLGVFYALKCF